MVKKVVKNPQIRHKKREKHPFNAAKTIFKYLNKYECNIYMLQIKKQQLFIYYLIIN